ncbi:MAG: hypothetical protein R2568_05960 [Candidatus Scalindua sp.]|jgi:uncharacterized coiled-coil protein SlyX|nr:hypothetical protein [Candidatus Scalindua sp.]
MKKLLIICTFALMLFVPGTVGFSDILKDLDSFQKSLGDWVTQIDELNGRISNMESEKASREKQTAELNHSLANIEDLLSDMDAKVERVENMSSLEGVKEIVKSFEGTLNVFKKRFSKLANRMEDQEVKTAVLERMYKTANKPLDTLMQALDEQKSVISRLGNKLEKQEELILSMKESLQKQSSPDESLVSGIEELNSRLSKLESGVLVQAAMEHAKHEEEKHASASDGHHEEAEHAAATAGHHEETKHAAAPAGHHEEAKHAAAPAEHHEEPQAHGEKTGLIDIGEGFFAKNIKFEPFGSSSQISGELINKSDRNHGMTDFKVQAYDNENIPLGDQGFSVYGFNKGTTKPFEEIIVGVISKDISKYAIYPAKMPLVSDEGVSTIKIIDREEVVAKAETKEEVVALHSLEDLIFDEKAHSEELEGFEDVGNGFYASNISFNGFGSSSSVTGNIKNNSENNFYNASFVLRVYSKAYGMITSLDFSVRSINSGDTKAFEEIVSGVLPVDIDRYEIAFKSSY